MSDFRGVVFVDVVRLLPEESGKNGMSFHLRSLYIVVKW